LEGGKIREKQKEFVSNFFWEEKVNNPYGGYNAYKEIGVKTASQGKLVVMLYEGAVSNLEKAMALVSDDGKIEPGNIENYGNCLQKVMDIITELEVSLNLDAGGEIAQNLMSLYVYFNKQILDATISHDKKKLSFVRDMMSELHESWITASNSTANAKTQIPGASPSLNITG
jgi:flagellar protein FliS